jgi:hypothetical protein
MKTRGYQFGFVYARRREPELSMKLDLGVIISRTHVMRLVSYPTCSPKASLNKKTIDVSADGPLRAGVLRLSSFLERLLEFKN